MRWKCVALGCVIGAATVRPCPPARADVPATRPAVKPAAASPATPLPPGFDPQRHMRVSEVREGMTGYGVSVFHGTQLERFDVKVISILRNFNPKYDVVLIDCHGANLEHTGAIAGMSGSPIYLKDDQGRERMIGAFAYGWPMVKDPIAGVQPIEYMLTLPANRQETEGGTSGGTAQSNATKRIRWSLIDDVVPLMKIGGRAATPLAATGRLGDDAPKLTPLATPLMTSGLSPRIVDQLNALMGANGMVALQAGGIGGSAAGEVKAELEPGSVLGVPLLTGDSEMTAIGTCTEVIHDARNGDRVLGFGHSFNNEGPIHLPMGTGRINGVVANLTTSFKLGAMGQARGTLLADQTVGVAGRTGVAPPMAPMDLRVVHADGSGEQSYHFNLAWHPKLTPMIAAAAMAAASSGTHDFPEFHTVDYDVELQFSDGQSLKFANTSVNAQVADLFNEIGLPIVAAAENPFDRLALRKLTGTIRVTPEAREARILSVTVPRLKYQPGETAQIFLQYRPFRGAEQTLPVNFELPRELPDGQYQLVITDWQQYLEGEKVARPFRFTAESNAEMFAALRDLMGVRHDAVYVQLVRKPDGVAVGRTAMPRLPSSRREVLMGAGLSSTTPFVSSTLKVVPTSVVMSGSANFAVTIDRAAKVDTKPGKPAVAPNPPAGKGEEPKPKSGAKTESETETPGKKD